MATTVRDLDGQRSIIIDTREDAVFLDGEDFCIEFDRGIFTNALRRESLVSRECVSCAAPAPHTG